MEMAELVTLHDAASMLHVTVETVRRYVREGRFPAARVGRRYLLRKQDVAQYLFQQFPANDPMVPS
jgi:excisionase family DNA binding protein